MAGESGLSHSRHTQVCKVFFSARELSLFGATRRRTQMKTRTQMYALATVTVVCLGVPTVSLAFGQGATERQLQDSGQVAGKRQSSDKHSGATIIGGDRKQSPI